MELLFQSEHLELRYNQNRDIFQGSWNCCDTADKLVDGLKTYKTIFEKIKPEKIVWDETGLCYTIPPKLQDWILDFLDIPACKYGINYRVAHVLSPDLYANLSLMDMYTEGKTSFTPRFFTHEKAAFNWADLKLTKPPVLDETSEPEWKIERFTKQNKARITIDVDLDDLPHYMFEFKKMMRNRRFYTDSIRRFSMLTPREKFVLALIIRGKANKEIADITSTSCETIKTHRRNLLRKLECRNMAELMMYQVFL
ncbi:LuxR C-terminal-related transcriptional regulator [Niabella drilacis]|uniref:Regulatory protein, luxR family n=1 Tax=Niabella drilacis (strain DSM 25811 / CCM 8410 / CCUG 62505 / LMG 26954 / E90) TaxID=1285928 RepID=A0A1G7BVM4_NIADE|nr:helix-turn-helix transcriptional regulator [Niabella drilacis]SDE31063.1 regulatory protein, luxR family [Niabella drilacis]